MRTIQFTCTLLSDVIINQKAATEGHQESLDFIPGSNFLGIAASIYGALSPEESLTIFHSGKVRFGDAHPLSEDNRTLRIPAAYHHQKGEQGSAKKHYILSAYNEDKEQPLQLKQCRSGFYLFSENTFAQQETEKSFAIKSAYDREKRRSMDEQMYGYQSIDKGLILGFEVEFDDDICKDLEEKISNALVGTKRVGRSRTAQYGLVEIKKTGFTSFGVSGEIIKDELHIYADGRLIFLDETTGLPTLQPTPKDFGVTDEKAEIDWTKSLIRTFQYAPWNFKRQARDTDRCGIEKGSVIVIKTAEKVSSVKSYVGSYKNEGFGKVIVNPEFLKTEIGTNGETLYKSIAKNTHPTIKRESGELNEDDKRVLNFLEGKKKEEDFSARVYKEVNEFVANNSNNFKDKVFASQWGQIRNLAMQPPIDKNRIDTKIDEFLNNANLFGGVEVVREFEKILNIAKQYDDKEKLEDKVKVFSKNNELQFKNKEFVIQWEQVYHLAKRYDDKNKLNEDFFDKKTGYLTHGVAAEKWGDRGRLEKLEGIFNNYYNDKNVSFSQLQYAIINLASEMGKKCRRK